MRIKFNGRIKSDPQGADSPAWLLQPQAYCSSHRWPSLSQDLPVVTVTARAPASPPWSIGGVKLFGDDGFNFRDVLDLINPIQHIPVLGNIYRSITGDIAAPAIRIAGGALFGGPIGAAFAAASVVLKRLIKPELNGSPPTAPDTALAVTSAPTESRGGWMVANSRAFPIPMDAVEDSGKAVASVDAAQLKQAYGLDQIEAQRRHLFGSFHRTA